MSKNIELGDEVKCKLTGFKGVASAHMIPLHGAERFSVQPPINKEGKIPDAFDIDACQLEVTAKGKIKATPSVTYEIELGDLVQDSISKLKGTVTAKGIFLNGCVHMSVTPKMNKKENCVPDSSWVSVQRLTLVKSARKKTAKVNTGGPITRSVKF